jgi:glutaredoxin
VDHDPGRVTLYSIPGHCPLCDVARAVLDEMVPGFAEIDIRTDRDLLKKYRNEIPVVVVDGVRRFTGRVDRERLRRILQKERFSSETDPPVPP